MQDIIDTEIKALQDRDIQVCVFDLDQTLINAHTKGIILETTLESFIKSISPVAIKLIPCLLKAGLKVAIATMTDELYNVLMTDRDKKSGKPERKYLSGRQLVIGLLESFLTKDEIKEITVVTINPDLYPSNDNEKCTFFIDKLISMGFNKDTYKPDQLDKVMIYPPLKNKDHHLTIIKELLKCQYKNILLIDDKIENIVGAVQLGCYGLHIESTEGSNGITEEHLDPKKILVK